VVAASRRLLLSPEFTNPIFNISPKISAIFEVFPAISLILEIHKFMIINELQVSMVFKTRL
jgi:hypothetical protein